MNTIRLTDERFDFLSRIETFRNSNVRAVSETRKKIDRKNVAWKNLIEIRKCVSGRVKFTKRLRFLVLDGLQYHFLIIFDVRSDLFDDKNGNLLHTTFNF